MLPEIPTAEFVAALDRCAENGLWEAGWDHPPIDAFALAERSNLVVAHDESMAERGRHVRLANQAAATIVLGPEVRDERRHWAVAHEIGEHLAHRVFGSLGVAPALAPPGARETVANHLASRLLLPTGWFAADGEACDWDLWELKALYATASHELIARRMLEMPPKVVMTLFDHGQAQWRRSNIVGCPPGLHPVEAEIWRTAHDSGRACQAASGDDRWPANSSARRVRSTYAPRWAPMASSLDLRAMRRPGATARYWLARSHRSSPADHLPATVCSRRPWHPTTGPLRHACDAGSRVARRGA